MAVAAFLPVAPPLPPPAIPVALIAVAHPPAPNILPGECSICLEGFEDRIKSVHDHALVNGHAANHRFHIGCLNGWAAAKNTFTTVSCPTCRADIDIAPITSLKDRRIRQIRNLLSTGKQMGIWIGLFAVTHGVIYVVFGLPMTLALSIPVIATGQFLALGCAIAGNLMGAASFSFIGETILCLAGRVIVRLSPQDPLTQKILFFVANVLAMMASIGVGVMILGAFTPYLTASCLSWLQRGLGAALTVNASVKLECGFGILPLYTDAVTAFLAHELAVR